MEEFREARATAGGVGVRSAGRSRRARRVIWAPGVVRAMGHRSRRDPLVRLAWIGAVAALLLVPGLPSTHAAPALPPPALASGLPMPGACPTRPVLSINATPSSGVAPLRVLLQANATGGCPPYQFQWQFGDEGEAEGPAVYHTFRGAGMFTVYGSVQDAAGAQASNRTTIHVSGGGGKIAVNVTAVPSAGAAPLVVTAWANVTGGNISQIGTVRWSFGDGGSGNGTPIVHTYMVAGTYHLGAAVTANGQSVNGSATILVATGSSSGPATNLSLLATPADAHPPANVTVYAFTNGVGAPLNLSVCFGDGSPCAAGPPRWNGSPPAVLLHEYGTAGVYAVQGTLTDPTGAVVESASVLVNISAGPALSVVANESVSSGPVPLEVTFLSNVSGGTPPYSIQWSFGDGAVGSSAPGGAVRHTYLSTGTFDPWLLVLDSAGNRRNITLAAIHVASSASLTAIPSTLGGVPTSDWVLTLAAATVVGGAAIALPASWRRREREREKEGEELVRELEERR